jgi:hypothetical protein
MIVISMEDVIKENVIVIVNGKEKIVLKLLVRYLVFMEHVMMTVNVFAIPTLVVKIAMHQLLVLAPL